MAYDEIQRGRGKFYSELGTGSDSTIEQAYLSAPDNKITVEGETIQDYVKELKESVEKIEVAFAEAVEVDEEKELLIIKTVKKDG